jgi:hypothetical protein
VKKPIRSGEFCIRDDLGIEITFDFRSRALAARWTPARRSRLEPVELDKYREIRDQFLFYRNGFGALR